MTRLIGLLSGTFDPVHRGHLELANLARRQLRLEEVWMLINAYPQRKEGVTPFAHRLAMMQRAGGGIEGVVTAREPVQREPQLHSLKLMQRLVQDYPHHEFSLIMGLEVFAGLDEWNDVAELVKLATFGVASSTGSAVTETARAVQSRIGPVAHDVRYYPIIIPPVEVSSTRVKRQLRAGQAPGDLAPAVDEYIRHHRLYR